MATPNDDSYAISCSFTPDGRVVLTFEYDRRTQAELLRDFPCLAQLRSRAWSGRRRL